MGISIWIDRPWLALGLQRARLPELIARLRESCDDANSPHERCDLPDFRAGVADVAAAPRAGEPIERYAISKGPLVSLMSRGAMTLPG